MNEYLKVLKQYGNFSGRARRREYWMFGLINGIITLVLTFLSMTLGLYSADANIGLLDAVYGLAVLVPSVAVSIRRLHDVGRSGWWLLIGLIPLVGPILLLVWDASEGQYGDNRWGPNPKTPAFNPAYPR